MSDDSAAPARGLSGGDELLGARVDDLLDAIAADTHGPGGGSVAAIVVALAAALLSMAARLSHEDWPEAGGAIAQAERLRRRAGPLAARDARAFREAIRALGGETRSESGAQTLELGSALARAAEIPLSIAETAADVATLAAEVAQRAKPDVRPDAAAAAVLAEAAARAAAHLVEVNLGATTEDERVRGARILAQMAADSARIALAAAAA
jgi:formiminotetrahydrofolate cyclodeaminase